MLYLSENDDVGGNKKESYISFTSFQLMAMFW